MLSPSAVHVSTRKVKCVRVFIATAPLPPRAAPPVPPGRGTPQAAAVDLNGVNRRPTMEPLAPTSGIGGAPLPKGGSAGAFSHDLLRTRLVFGRRGPQRAIKLSTMGNAKLDACSEYNQSHQRR